MEITKETRQLSFYDISKKKKARYEQILEILSNKEMTAKEVAVEMYKRGLTDSTDRNYSHPRLNELVDMGYVEVAGKKECEYTKKKVAVYRRKKKEAEGVQTMISKEQFVEIIDRLREIYDFYADVWDRAKKIKLKYTIDTASLDDTFSGEYESIILKLLENMFNDESENISWWIYELDFGRKYTEDCIQDANGKSIDVSTAEKLYDFLTKEMEEQKNERKL